MSEIWNFSPSLESEVLRCIKASQKDENNKWLNEFGHLKRDINFLQKSVSQTLIDLSDSPDFGENDVQKNNGEHIEVEKMAENNKLSELDDKNFDEIKDSLENDFLNNIDLMINDCMKNSLWLTSLANQLSVTTIEKICSSIYERKDIHKQFICNFFEYFLPVYIKREYNSNTLDILVRSHKTHPLEFKMLLKMLISDVTISTKVLQDYILTLNEEECANFITDIAEFDMSNEEFVNNLFTIYTAYKDCKKTEPIQRYVESMLSQYSTCCVTDRHYGRLFLAFIQSQKTNFKSLDCNNLEKLLEDHKSPFKRPCLTLIKELSCPNNGNDFGSESEEY